MPMVHQLQPVQRRARCSWKRWRPLSWRPLGILPLRILGLGALGLPGLALAAEGLPMRAAASPHTPLGAGAEAKQPWLVQQHRLAQQPWLAQLPPAPTKGERPCQLVERNQPIFSGSCRLSRQNAASGGDYLVQLGGGKLYRFQRRGTLLVLNDASGRWPVLVAERANEVQFRWAGLMLAISRQRSGRSEALGGAWLAPSTSPRSTGETKQDLLDHLFSS